MRKDELEILYEVLLDYVERYGLTDKAREMLLSEPRKFDGLESQDFGGLRPSNQTMNRANL